jgi:predicted AlkP superfamily pyrophosphatase or phosphodiesterase
MTNRLMVINVVGLTRELVGADTPNLQKLLAAGSSGSISPVLPAVTCTAQATYLTGKMPSDHGIVGNGWYFEDQSEVRLWHQSNRLMQGEKLWETMRRRDPAATCANLFWWFNMYSTADYSVTVRPMYPADGRKIPDIYTQPTYWRQELNAQLGQFPLFKFWGPMSDITSSRWIVDATLETLSRHQPTLTLVYLPHLDYCLQKFGPGHACVPDELRAIDAECGRLLDAAQHDGIQVVVLSEYGIEAAEKPVHLNRVLRQAGYITLRDELGRELLDAGASRAFAVADHQLAHIYVQDAKDVEAVRLLVEAQPGVARVLDAAGKVQEGLDHPRSGDLVAVADRGAWFTYYYWLEEDRAPDFAHCVDIHRKPGYDPVELYIDPNIRIPLLATGWRLLKKNLGLRTLMDVIPTDAGLVQGTHGRPPDDPDAGALYISSAAGQDRPLQATAVKDFLLDMMFPAGG